MRERGGQVDKRARSPTSPSLYQRRDVQPLPCSVEQHVSHFEAWERLSGHGNHRSAMRNFLILTLQPSALALPVADPTTHKEVRLERHIVEEVASAVGRTRGTSGVRHGQTGNRARLGLADSD